MQHDVKLAEVKVMAH